MSRRICGFDCFRSLSACLADNSGDDFLSRLQSLSDNRYRAGYRRAGSDVSEVCIRCHGGVESPGTCGFSNRGGSRFSYFFRSRDFSDDSRDFLRSGGSLDCLRTCGRKSSYRKSDVRYELGRAPRESSLDSGEVETLFLQRLSRALDFLSYSVSSSEKFLPDVHDSSDEFWNRAGNDSRASDDGFRGFTHRFHESRRASCFGRLRLCLLDGCGRRLRFRCRSVESLD